VEALGGSVLARHDGDAGAGPDPRARDRGLRLLAVVPARPRHRATVRAREALADRVRRGDPRAGSDEGGRPPPARRAAPADLGRRVRARDDAARPRHHRDPRRDDVRAGVRRGGPAPLPDVRERHRRGDRGGFDHERGLPEGAVPRLPASVGRCEEHRVPAGAVALRARFGRMDGRRARRLTPEVAVRAERAHRLHLLDPRRGARPARRARGPRRVRRADLRGHPDRGQREGRVRPVARGRDRVVVRPSDADQPRGGHRPAPHHRCPPPVPLVRGVLARGLARGRRRVGEHRSCICPCPRPRLCPCSRPRDLRSSRTAPSWPPRTDPADARRLEASPGSACACPRPRARATSGRPEPRRRGRPEPTPPTRGGWRRPPVRRAPALGRGSSR